MDAGARVPEPARSGGRSFRARRCNRVRPCMQSNAWLPCCWRLRRRLLLLGGLLLLGLPTLLPLPGAAHHRPGCRGFASLVLAVFLLDVAVDPVIGLVLVAAHFARRPLRRPRRRRHRAVDRPAARVPERGPGRQPVMPAWPGPGRQRCRTGSARTSAPSQGSRVEACRWPATVNASSRLARVIGCLMIVSLDWGERQAGSSLRKTAGMPGDRGCAFAVYRSSLRRDYHDHCVRHSTATGLRRACGHCSAGGLLSQRQAECSHGQLPIRRLSCPGHVLRARTGGSTALTGAGRCGRISCTLA